jgi:ubiquinone/menaquinone biosynthesis C-methylase UbiE
MILDIGCGQNPKGNINVDIDKTVAKKAKIPNFIVADACYLPFKTRTFALAIASHVLEHLPNPLDTLTEWKRIARNVEVLTPSPFDLDKTKDHLYTWNAHTFKNLLLKVFANVNVGYTSKFTLLRGRLGKYAPITNLLLSKLGFKRELKAYCY